MQLLAFCCHGIPLITLPPADQRDWDIPIFPGEPDARTMLR